MFTPFAIENLLGGRERNSKPPGECRNGHRWSKRDHFKRLLIRKHPTDSSLSHPIGCVVVFRADEEVAVSHARPYITFVKNEQAIRNRTMFKLPCELMSRNRSAVNPEGTISGRCFAGSPKPASVLAALDLAPKSFFGAIHNE